MNEGGGGVRLAASYRRPTNTPSKPGRRRSLLLLLLLYADDSLLYLHLQKRFSGVQNACRRPGSWIQEQTEWFLFPVCLFG